jgi:hypothetical protein
MAYLAMSDQDLRTMIRFVVSKTEDGSDIQSIDIPGLKILSFKINTVESDPTTSSKHKPKGKKMTVGQYNAAVGTMENFRGSINQYSSMVRSPNSINDLNNSSPLLRDTTTTLYDIIPNDESSYGIDEFVIAILQPYMKKWYETEYEPTIRTYQIIALIALVCATLFPLIYSLHKIRNCFLTQSNIQEADFYE